MYQSHISNEGDSEYSVTPAAQLVDRYAISYGDVDRYPDPVAISVIDTPPKTSIPNPVKWIGWD